MELENLKNCRTPFYLYDLEVLRNTLNTLTLAANRYNYQVHYAVKANANDKILEEIVGHGLGADCVSGNEILRAMDCGFKVNQVVFAGVGKADWEIEIAIDNDILNFNCESLQEIFVINEIATLKNKVVDIAIRVNPNVNANTHEKITTGIKNNKFGINYHELFKVLAGLEKYENINLTGLHFHIGSQITDMNAYVELCKKVNYIQDELGKQGFEFSYLNMGGGLGIDYHSPETNPIPDFQTYFKIFNDNLILMPGQQVHFELGRSVVGNMGSLISKVLYTKGVEDINYAILDAGMTELIRPALYESFHKIENLTSVENEMVPYDVVGPICESSDYFAKERLLPVTKRGDLLAIRSVGAYGEVMASNYNLRNSPIVQFVG